MGGGDARVLARARWVNPSITETQIASAAYVTEAPSGSKTIEPRQRRNSLCTKAVAEQNAELSFVPASEAKRLPEELSSNPGSSRICSYACVP